MAFSISDVQELAVLKDDTARTTYTVPAPATNFLADTLYLMCCLGLDTTTAAEPATVVTAGLTWTRVDGIANSLDSVSIFKAVPSATVTAATTAVNYDSQQTNGVFYIVEILNTDGINSIIGTNTKTLTSTNVEINISLSPLVPGNLALVFVGNTISAFWEEDGTTITTMLTTNPSRAAVGLNFDDSPDFIINTGVQGTLKSAVAIEILALQSTPEYTEKYTMELTAVDGTTPVICSSTNFALGVTIEIWPANVEANKDVAFNVVAITTLDSSAPQVNATHEIKYDSGAGDTIHIIYDPAVGNIQSVNGGIAIGAGVLTPIEIVGTIC